MTLLLEAGVPHCPLFRSTRIGGRVAYWHFSAVPTALSNVGHRGQTGKHLLALSFTDFDPGRSLKHGPGHRRSTTMLAYVFWHWPLQGLDRGDYEATLLQFHRS